MGPKQLQRLMQLGVGRQLYFRFRYGAKEGVRKVLGDQLYHNVWCWLANWKPEEGLELEVDTLPNEKQVSRRS
jgi:hypothetical protein